MESVLEFVHVSKRFLPRGGWWSRRPHPVTALRDVSFSLTPGSIVAIVGPNGAGKSTVLRLAAGVLLPDEGIVRRALPMPGAINYIPSTDQGFYWRLSVRDNLLFFARLSNFTPREAMARVEALASEFDIAGELDQPFETLSSGRRQRVFSMRAMLRPEPLLLADEPTRSVDPHHREFLHAFLRARRRAGAAVLFVTHDVLEAQSLADEILLVSGGEKRAAWRTPDWTADAGLIARTLAPLHA